MENDELVKLSKRYLMWAVFLLACCLVLVAFDVQLKQGMASVHAAFAEKVNEARAAFANEK